MSKWLRQRRKAVASLIGAVATWALTEFPDNHDVHIYGGLILALLTVATVHQVENERV